MPETRADLHDVLNAILDLTRVTLATSGSFGSKAEAVRKLAELSVPPSRIAQILAMPLPHVTSAIAKARKSQKGKASTGVRAEAVTGD